MLTDNKEFTSASIIMGAVSESNALVETVERIVSLVDEKDVAEILIAYPDNRITHDCRMALEKLKRAELGVNLVIFPQSRPGLGFVTDAIDRASGSHCIPFQSDMAVDPYLIAEFISRAKTDPDTVFTASRWLPGCKVEGYGRCKKLVNAMAQVFLRILFGGGYTDYTNPLMIIRTDIYKQILWERNDYSRFLEMFLKPLRLGCRFFEIPVDYHARTEGSTSNGVTQWWRYFSIALHVRCMKKEKILKPEYRSGGQ